MNPTPPFWIVCIDPTDDPYERERDPIYRSWEGERFLPIFTDRETADVFIKGMTDTLVDGELLSRPIQDDAATMAVVRFGQANRVFSYAVNPVHGQRPSLVRF